MLVDDSAPMLLDEQAKRAKAQQLSVVLSAIGIGAGLGFWLGGATLHLPSAIVLAVVPPVLVYLVQLEPGHIRG